MLNKKEKLERDYRYKRKNYEEKRVEWIKQRDKALSVIEEVEERSHYYLKDFVPDKSLLMKGYRQSEHIKENIIELTNENIKKLNNQLEDLDSEYYCKLRALDDEDER